jgi:hypothetical protein
MLDSLDTRAAPNGLKVTGRAEPPRTRLPVRRRRLRTVRCTAWLAVADVFIRRPDWSWINWIRFGLRKGRQKGFGKWADNLIDSV